MQLYLNILPYDLQEELFYYFSYDEIIAWFSDYDTASLILQNYLHIDKYWLKRLELANLHVDRDQFHKQLEKLQNQELISGRNRQITASDVYFYLYTLENYCEGAEDFHSLLVCGRNLAKRKNFKVNAEFYNKHRKINYNHITDDAYWLETIIGAIINCKTHEEYLAIEQSFIKESLSHTCHTYMNLHGGHLKLDEAITDYNLTDIVGDSTLLKINATDSDKHYSRIRSLVRQNLITDELLYEIDDLPFCGAIYILQACAYINNKELIERICSRLSNYKYEDRNIHYHIIEGAIEGGHINLVRRSISLIQDKDYLYSIIIKYILKYGRLEMLNEFIYEISRQELDEITELYYYGDTHPIAHYIRKHRQKLRNPLSITKFIIAATCVIFIVMSLIKLYSFIKNNTSKIKKFLLYTTIISISTYILLK